MRVDDVYTLRSISGRPKLPAYFYVHALDGSKPVPAPRGPPLSWYGQATFNASVDGVCQETCRDLAHVQFGMASALYAAETAGIQGVDLLVRPGA